MAYLGKGPEQVLSGVASKSTFTGDGSTTTFDISTDIPAGGENDIQVFVDNVRQEPGSGASYTVGVDGSGNLRRITFNVAPEASQSIYVINPRRLEAFGQVPDGAIATTKLQDTSVTTAKITDLNVTTGKIAADAITEAKIADNAISEEHLDNTVVTSLTELSEARNDGDFVLIYDSSTGTLKKIQASNLGILAPTLSSISPTNVLTGDGTGNATFTVTGTNFSTGTTAVLVTDGGSEVAFDTVTRDSQTQLTCVIAKSSLSNANEPYDIKVTSNSISTTLTDQVNIDAQPIFNTASGSLGSVVEGNAFNGTIEAYDPDSAGNVTFELQSGSLPAGLTASTVNENGVSKYVISGTASSVGSDTTTNFVLRAVDAASNTSSRAFSITVTNFVAQSFTASGTFTVPSGITSVDVLVVGGGGGGGSQHAGGGGAGGLIFFPGYPVSPGGTVTVTVGCGGAGNSTTGGKGATGSDTTFGSPGDPGFSPTSSVLTAKGGGGGGGFCGNGPGLPGGSGGGGGAHTGGFPGGTGTQPTQPGNSGAYGFGNNGGPSICSANGGAGGGGGGAGAGGSQNSPASRGGDGGVGKAYTIADDTTPVYYAGGGGGGSHSGEPGGTGGQGGGGAGGNYQGGDGANGTPGTANTGGGGGGSGQGPNPGGDGGKGVVIVRWS